jgi:hypothetical protein
MKAITDWEESSTATDDRRRHPRRASRRTTATLYAPDGQAGPLGEAVTLVDLSLRGVGFRSAGALAVGKRYGLELRGNWMDLSSRIRVVSCRPGEGGGFEIGAEFC